MTVRAVVVDDRWWVAVAGDRLPGGPRQEDEPAEDAIRRVLAERHGLAVEVVAALGDTLVAHARSAATGLDWRPPSALGLADEEERRLVRKALGPC